MAKKLDWNRVRRERVVAEHGAERADVERPRAVPASDRDVAKLVELGYAGPRPATRAQARELLRKLREKRNAESADTDPRTGTSLAAVERLIDDFARTGSRGDFDAQTLSQRLNAAYRRELAKIESSRAKAATKWDRQLQLTSRHMGLKRKLSKAIRRQGA